MKFEFMCQAKSFVYESKENFRFFINLKVAFILQRAFTLLYKRFLYYNEHLILSGSNDTLKMTLILIPRFCKDP